MNRIALLIILCACVCAAQSISLTVSPSSVQAGGSATPTLTYADAQPTANIAGIEWALTLPSGVTAGVPTLGAASVAASKSLTCGPQACVVIGAGPTLNSTAIGSGVAATIPVTVAAGTSPGSMTLGLLTVGSNGLTGVTGPGTLAMVSSNTAILTVLSKYDLNGDGVLSAADVSIILNEVDGTTASCTAPSSGVGDGKCSLLDVELEILAVLGVIR